jgi:CelD/BcsL family acetyltransferase involved in cellulose biosynthesis
MASALSLRVNDEIAAVTYCFQANGRFYLYQHGFNPRFWQYSVGVVVLGLTIRSAIEEGDSEFDMLYGEEPYKGSGPARRGSSIGSSSFPLIYAAGCIAAPWTPSAA